MILGQVTFFHELTPLAVIGVVKDEVLNFS